MNMPALILTITAAALSAASANPQDKVNPPARERVETSAEKIKELQKERIAALEDLAVLLTKLFQSGKASYQEVLEAQSQLLKARLDAAEKDSERIALYQRCVEVLKASEELAKAQMQAARGSMAAVLAIKARRLEIEIQLERAKAKEAKANR
jgi:outer membrane protein TolC